MRLPWWKNLRLPRPAIYTRAGHCQNRLASLSPHYYRVTPLGDSAGGPAKARLGVRNYSAPDVPRNGGSDLAKLG
jgi:hypothetical protein